MSFKTTVTTIVKSIPCHRVIKSNGEFGKYNGLKGKKSELLLKGNSSSL